jgi:tripartite motif-containing protein 37
MDHIDDYTKCYICLGKLVDATMCPHCNKLSCQRCIQVTIGIKKKWLLERKSQCPLCRMTLKFSQLITCKFMNDIVVVNHLLKI